MTCITSDSDDAHESGEREGGGGEEAGGGGGEGVTAESSGGEGGITPQSSCMRTGVVCGGGATHKLSGTCCA
jgi:hypothetical protein